MLVRFLLFACLASIACGFYCPPAGAETKSKLLSVSSSTRLFSEVTTTSTEAGAVGGGGVDRRKALLQAASSLGSVAAVAAAVAVTGTAGWKYEQSTSDATTSTGALLQQPLIITSVEDTVALIDSQCDRRFLHALVATDYQQLLYRDVVSSRDDAKYPSIVSTQSVTKEIPVATDFLKALDSTSTKEDFSANTPFHLTTTGTNSKGTASASTKMMSLWPLGSNVHFAWPEQGQDMLWSQAEGNLMTTAASPSKTKKLIVDGVDCGVMSLEDALERPNGQMMVHADSFLLVPTSMEKELIARLKDSFII